MRVARLVLIALCAAGSAGPLAGQIPIRRPSAGQSGGSSGSRLLVGNPHTFSPADSAASVAIADGLRGKVDKLVGTVFRVLTRQEMNDALQQYGYPKDAILSVTTTRVLAQALNSKAMVVSTLSKDQAGHYVVTSRFGGINDDAANVVSVTQAAGQGLPDVGVRVAEGFASSLKAFPDAKACVDQSKTAPDKALAAGRKALATVPKHGLANFCLGKLVQARGKKSDSTEATRFFQDAVTGDPLSLAAWTELAAGYEAAGDTVKTIAALQQMLRIAPTNGPLRDLVFKKFLSYGKPELAEQVADEGLALDPGNVDLYELRANARAFRENYSGALDDLEQIIVLDSTRADSTFYVKYLVFASQKPDSARLVHWSSLALAKFPENVTLIKQAAGAYAQVGQADSLATSLNLLVKYDSAGAVGFALQQAKVFQDAKQNALASPFIDFAVTNGDAQSREGAASLMLNGTLPLIQPPQDWKGAADGFRRVITIANPQGRYVPIANYFLGLALVNLIIPADKEAEAQKSCDAARQVETLIAETEAALAGAPAYIQGSGASQSKTYDQLNGYLTSQKPRTASMIKVYCK
ncbi:MAG: hypothetical protein SGJ01_09570 [Gemmatimonadota bacterium]|nr:hypothetical protein [Gemmatimonadota bacterium]